MDTKLKEAEGYGEDGSGKKKSKFKSFKKLFVKKKKKETLPSLAKTGLKPSQSASDVTASESMLVGSDSEEEIGSPKGILGNRALSHDSIFIPEAVQEPVRPVRVFSQENVSENIRALQLKIQHKLKIVPPTRFGIPAKRIEDAGTSSEDDGLPRSPPEMSLLHETISCNTTSKISSSPSSRPLSPEDPSLPRRAACPQAFDGSMSPSADFDLPPQCFTCLDNSAAKHRLSIKPRHQRANNMRRLSSRMQSETFTDLSCTLEEEEDGKGTLAGFSGEYPNSKQQETEGTTSPISHTACAQSPGEPQSVSPSLEDESARIDISNDVSSTMLEVSDPEKNVLTDPGVVESRDHADVVEANPDGETKMEEELPEKFSVSNENVEEIINGVNPERKPEDSSAAQTPYCSVIKQNTQEDGEAPMEIYYTELVHEGSTIGASVGKQLPNKSSLKHSVVSPHGNKNPSHIPHLPLSSWPLGKSKSVGELSVPDKENSQSEKKAENVANELSALRKFSVSSAWERPRTESFNMKGNVDVESLKNTQFSIFKTHVAAPRREKTKEDVCTNSDHPEKKTCIKTQEYPVASESRPADKMMLRAFQTGALPPMSDSFTVSESQSDSEDKSPFQVKLRSTSLSLRYRESYSIESKTVKKNSAEFKSEQVCHTSLSKVGTQLQIKRASEVNTSNSLNDNVKSKPQSHEQFYEKPPLPRKPVLQNITISSTNISTEKQEKATKPSDFKTENKVSEKRSSFSKVAVSSTLSLTQSAKGTESLTKPTWMNLAQQKQRGLEEPKFNPEEKHSSCEGDTEKKNKEKERLKGHMKQQSELIKNKPSRLASKTMEEYKQETKPELEETRKRAQTLPYPISVAQSSFLLEKEEKAHFKQTNHSSLDQPSWMELAKKKSQAWSDRPQIIK
ncbi:uncharacterized protein KIAA1211-like homolog isoform X2 [Rhinatrema bivittatum]|uniref:uncharacterized protein KIAA1211-like homolog isoform X2 n=1 Tax=Rhinatrema bivittatum TaxID=194408 RepID=UPI001127221B|nr:uncharacterized protein KIAA1211-like homolog isoform X2 [Rhinatrema bivittatum]